MLNPKVLNDRLTELRKWQKSRGMRDTSFWLLLNEIKRGGTNISASELGKLLHKVAK